jgi:hypothetical protein
MIDAAYCHNLQNVDFFPCPWMTDATATCPALGMTDAAAGCPNLHSADFHVRGNGGVQLDNELPVLRHYYVT